MLKAKKAAKKRPATAKLKRAVAPAGRAAASSGKAVTGGRKPLTGAKRGGGHARERHAVGKGGSNARASTLGHGPQAPGKGKDGRRAPLPRKPSPRPSVDVGIGAVDIAPPKGAPRTLGMAAAEAALEKKAFQVVLLDVHGISGLCDEMVVASANSVTHLGAVCDGVEEALKKQGERVLRTDGRHGAEPDWILLDYGNVMVHLFRPEARQRTRLEEYYSAARLVAQWKND